MRRKIVNSSNLRSVGYNSTEMILEVEFTDGSVYRYYDIPSGVHAALMSAASHGNYHYYQIKDRYRYQKIC